MALGGWGCLGFLGIALVFKGCGHLGPRPPKNAGHEISWGVPGPSKLFVGFGVGSFGVPGTWFWVVLGPFL